MNRTPNRTIYFLPFLCFLWILSTGGIPDFTADNHNFDVCYYELDIHLKDLSSQFSAQATIQFHMTEPATDTIRLDASQAILMDSVYYNGSLSAYRHRNKKLCIPVSGFSRRNGLNTVSVFYKRKSSFGQDFFEPLSARFDPDWNIYTLTSQSEPNGAAEWFPCKQVLSDKADSVKISVTVPKGTYAVSNGVLAQKEPVGKEETRFVWKSNYPIAYYLISIAVSDYIPHPVSVPVGKSDTVRVVHYLYNRPGYLKSYQSNFNQLELAIQWFSEKFGPYPFIREKYGQAMAPMGGGIENQTITTLSNMSFSLMAHELAHSWFGNMVTCKSWNDVWINEGLASYAEYMAIGAIQSPDEAAQWMQIAQGWAGRNASQSCYIPEEELKNSWRIFDNQLTYQKGACIMHMLRYEINDDEVFFHVLNRFLSRFAYKTASVGDFIGVLDEVTGSSYQWFFDQWYYKPGTPEYDLRWKTEGKTLIVDLIQHANHADNPLFRTHFDLLIHYKNQKTKKIRIFMDQSEETYTIPVTEEVTKVLFDPD